MWLLRGLRRRATEPAGMGVIIDSQPHPRTQTARFTAGRPPGDIQGSVSKVVRDNEASRFKIRDRLAGGKLSETTW